MANTVISTYTLQIIMSSLTSERKVFTSGEERPVDKTSSEHRTTNQDRGVRPKLQLQSSLKTNKFTGKLEGMNGAIFDIVVRKTNKFNKTRLELWFMSHASGSLSRLLH